jgi:hypothetical protein
LTFGSRNVGQSGVLASLQRAEIGNNCPTVTGLDPVRHRIHPADAVRDYVEEMADRCPEQGGFVIRRRGGETTPNDNAATVAILAMAR